MLSKHFIKKIVALSLVISPLIQTYLSLNQLLFVLPKISFVGDPVLAQSLYIQLSKQAIIISLTLFTSSIYGFSLLLRPVATTKYFNIGLGIILFILSVIISRTSAINLILNKFPFVPITWSTKVKKKHKYKILTGLLIHSAGI